MDGKDSMMRHSKEELEGIISDSGRNEDLKKRAEEALKEKLALERLMSNNG